MIVYECRSLGASEVCLITYSVGVVLVQNPDGSMQRAAMTQTALSKERREVKQAQREEQADNVPKDLGKLWIDPVPNSRVLTLTHNFCMVNDLIRRGKIRWRHVHFNHNPFRDIQICRKEPVTF